MTNARQLTPGLIQFLYQPHIVQSMREMSDRGRPAVEGVGALLLDHFGDAVSEDPALDLALKLDDAVKRDRPDAWRGVQAREQVIKEALYKILQDEAEVERIFLIIKAQREY